MKTRLFVFLVAAMFLLSIMQTYASIKDVNSCSGFAKEAVKALYEENIIKGDNKGNFHPKKEITRAEFLKMLIEAAGINTTQYEKGFGNVFKDVPESHWAKKYIMAAHAGMIVNGVTSDTFSPNEKITREQMATLFFRTIVPPTDWLFYGNYDHVEKFKDKGQISSWAKKGIEIMRVVKLMEGTAPGVFSPKSYATKEQAAVVIHRYLSNRRKINTDLLIYDLALFDTESKPHVGKFVKLGMTEEAVYDVMGATRLGGTVPVDMEVAVFNIEEGISVTLKEIPVAYFLVIPYTDSAVYLSGGKVVGWSKGGKLSVKVDTPKTGQPFTFGSSLEEVFRAMGTPEEILINGNTFYIYYKGGFIQLINNKVMTWTEHEDHRLNVKFGDIDPKLPGFTYRDKLEDVTSVMGTPQTLCIDERGIVLEYGKSFVYLSSDYEVKDWYNKGELKIRKVVVDENAPAIRLGSSKYDVVKAMGDPDRVDGDSRRRWFYQDSWLNFNSEGAVEGWSDTGNLKLADLAAADKTPIRIGSLRDEVFASAGTPEYYFDKQIKYGNSLILHDQNNRVTEIQNKDKNLKIAQNETGTRESFRLGDALEKILDSMGNPDAMRYDAAWQYYSTIVHYGTSELHFRNDALIGYVNADSNLLIDLGKAASARYFTYFSTFDDVIGAMGTPKTVLTADYGRELYYGQSQIRINKNGKVSEWYNHSNNLKLDKSISSNAGITFGMPLAEVMKTMGAPDWFIENGSAMPGMSNYTIRYGNSVLLLITRSNEPPEVSGWTNKGELKLENIIPPQGKPFITIGDTMEKVIRLKGLPDQAYYIWSLPVQCYFVYDKTEIIFGDNKVIGSIYNGSKDLRLFDNSPANPSNAPIRLGSTKAEVLQALGEPIRIKNTGYYAEYDRLGYSIPESWRVLTNSWWEYENGFTVFFNAEEKLAYFNDNTGQIDLGYKQTGAPEIKIGSYLEDVLRRYGAPIHVKNQMPDSHLEYIAGSDAQIEHNGKVYKRLFVRLNKDGRVYGIYGYDY